LKNNRIIFLTHTDDFFGQTRKPWISMDIKKTIEYFKSMKFDVIHYTFHEIYNKNIILEDENIFYSFSQKENVRNYIKDILYNLSFNNRLIPSLDLLYCHENKGFQELLKYRLGFKSLKYYYFNTADDTKDYQFNYPIILKTVDGSNGKGVFLIENENQLNLQLEKFKRIGSFFTYIDLFRRKYFRKRKFKDYPDHSDSHDYLQYKKYITKEKNFILQEFIPNLKYDYRVLIIGEKYYVMKRHVKDGDFRASGTKKFDFDFEVNPKLLDYAKKVSENFKSPFLSIDIADNGNDFYLIEYQALHFGINVLVKSKGYYIYDNQKKWDFMKNDEKINIETELARAVVEYLGNK